MKKYDFHCQLKLKRMANAEQRLKFNAEFSCIPRINERVMFYELCHHFLENREEEQRLHSFFSPLDFDDPISVTCKVAQIIHFDKTTIEEHASFNSDAMGKNAIGVLYLDELENEPICPTGAP